MQTLDVGSPLRPAAAAALERTLLIRAEQIRAQYRVMPGAFFGSALVATVVVAMLYDRLSLNVMLPWLAAIYMLSLARFALWRWFKQANPAVPKVTRWGRLAIAAGGLSGLLWGVGGIVLHDRTSLS
ncbi:MAG: hypothetical protein JWO52_1632, partial [Gammaproteobacteria bacterium]|nr:hypothetical protein [Gammaproteobacteria bacterium]